MATETLWAGLDLGQLRTNYCIIDSEGETTHEGRCETGFKTISDALAVVPKDQIGLIAAEAGSDTHVVRKLKEAGFPVALFEARKASKFLAIRRNKSDASDARGLADLARLGRKTVSQVYIKSPPCQQLRSQLVMRDNLIKLRVTGEAALRSLLALHGKRLRASYSPKTLQKHVLEAVHELKSEEGIDLAANVEPLLAVCVSLRTYLQKLDSELERRAANDPVCRRLMEVTGVGTICSLWFYSTIEDPTRFPRPSDIAAYLGLTPRRRQSGEVSYIRHISRMGCKQTRTLLVTAALVFSDRGPDSELKAWAVTLKDRIGGFRSRVALARKLAILLLIMWKNDAHFVPHPSKQRLGSP